MVLLVGFGQACAAKPAMQEESAVNRMVIYADKGQEQISRNIYGHFSEHLGRCIYEGFCGDLRFDFCNDINLVCNTGVLSMVCCKAG